MGRPVPDRRVPDRLGHVVQHERQRGASPRSASERLGDGGAPERSRQRLAVVQRRVPVGDPPRGRARRSTAQLIPALEHLATALRKKQREFERKVVKIGPHPPHGRHPGHARPGVRRLRGAGRAGGVDAAARRAAPRRRAAARRHRGRHRHQRAEDIRPRRHHEAGRTHSACRSPRRTTTSPPRARATRWSSVSGDLRALAVALVKIANDIRWMGSGPAHRAGRDPHPRPATGLVDHAGQGEPGHGRGGDPGVRAGVSATTPRWRSADRRATSS